MGPEDAESNCRYALRNPLNPKEGEGAEGRRLREGGRGGARGGGGTGDGAGEDGGEGTKGIGGEGGRTRLLGAVPDAEVLRLAFRQGGVGGGGAGPR